MNESKVNGSHGAKDKMPPGPHPPKNSMPNRMPPDGGQEDREDP